ncbi:hypothetical protein NXY11_05715 [Parabacteroides faecis]|uniref:hypothetical protein n=1 Tax=Parabacteroides faecis TaxID=1217282 RepID=UPI0021644483|nr:hypothetical protein [Parabacteroides faecis]MCS2893670.1 hypothetical protein [Parabacteroides faecis]UVQ47738.1 hypothetical protein NXY11_05715 [Parabacteroides faecis]
MWGRSLLVSVGLLVVLLPGCSAGRRSVQHREIREEVHSVHNDSMLLRNLYQASRNKVIDIEHVVFDSCRSDGVQSVTRVAIKEQGKVEAKSVVSSGSADERRSVDTESFQGNSVTKFSFSKWGLVWGIILLGFLFYAGIRGKKRI